MSRENKYIQRIKSVTSKVECLPAVEALVARYRESSDSLESLARRLGVSAILEESLPFEGCILADGQLGFSIKVNSDSSRTRRRFTLAHELGHLIIADLSGSSISCDRDQDLERACDVIAAELLMPCKDVIEFVKAQGCPSPKKLRSISEAFGVSLHMAALRVHEDLKLWKHPIGLWRFKKTAEEVWFVGKRPWKERRLEWFAFESALNSLSTIVAQETYRVGEREKAACLKVLNLGYNENLGCNHILATVA